MITLHILSTVPDTIKDIIMSTCINKGTNNQVIIFLAEYDEMITGNSINPITGINIIA